MKTESKNMNHIIRLKETLKPYSKPKIILGSCVFLVAMILIFIHWPLLTEVSNTANQLKSLQSKLLNQHSSVAAMEDMCAKIKIIQQNEIPPAIAALAEKGRSLGLTFKAISPGELQETDQSGIGRTPINLTIESEYKTLGQFLSYIEELSCGVMEIKSMSINSSKETLPRLNTEIMLDLFVEVENES